MRRCRYQGCRRELFPPKANYYFCSWACHPTHMAEPGHDYRHYQRSRDQSYDRAFRDGARPRPSDQDMPPHIWKALAVLAHPDKWQDAPEGLKELSHEAMIWLNLPKSMRAEND